MPIDPEHTRTHPQLARWKDLTEHLLPTRACDLGWPIRLDHCFKRITLDHACSDVWYRHLPRPAERHLAGPILNRALAAAESLLTGDRSTLDRLNQASLRYRGKLPAHHTEHPRSKGRPTA